MNEFERKKKDILSPIYFEAGAALFDCQAFEAGIAYFLYLLGRLGKNDVDPAQIAAILDGEEKKTAGQLIHFLKQKVKVSPGIESGLAEALTARNNLIHRFLYDNIERLSDFSEHEKIVAEIHVLRFQVQKSQKQLQPFIELFAKLTDGLGIDEVKAFTIGQFMRDAKEP